MIRSPGDCTRPPITVRVPVLLKEIKAPHTFKREVKRFILNQPDPYET